VKATWSLKELIQDATQLNNEDDGTPFGALYKGSASPNGFKGNKDIMGLYNLKKKSTITTIMDKKDLDSDFDDSKKLR